MNKHQQLRKAARDVSLIYRDLAAQLTGVAYQLDQAVAGIEDYPALVDPKFFVQAMRAGMTLEYLKNGGTP